jgi:ketosteroid isomerase-like protein
MTSTAAEQEILGLEKTFWDAMKNGDGATAARLTAESSIVIGPQGIAELEPSALKGMIESAPYKLERYSFDEKDVHVRTIGGDTAVITYKINEELTVDGQQVELDAYDASVWVRRDGRWTCVLHTESVAGDPFGRDRTKTKT